MKTLIVYYSYSGNNEILAQHLQQKLSCDILKIEEKGKRWGISIFLDLMFQRVPRLKSHKSSLDRYEHFVFIAPIWAGKIASPLRAFLMNEKNHIRSYSFITVCGGGVGQLYTISKELKELIGIDAAGIKELWINNLLSADKRNTIKYTTGYRLTPADLDEFKNEVDEFVQELMHAVVK